MGVVMQIGERKITEAEMFPLLAKYGMLPQLSREIIVEQAIADITCTPEEKTLAQNRFYQQQQLTNEAQIKAWLDQYGMTPEQLEQLSLRDLKLEKFKQATWSNKLEAYFLQCKGQLDKVVYSLVRNKDPGIAQEIYFRIQEQESSLADIAREYSQGTESQTGGLIGLVELNVPHPKIAQMLMSSKPGQLWPPTQVGEWFIIIRLEKYISAQLDGLTQQRLLNDLFQNWLVSQMQQKVTLSPHSQANEEGSE